MSILYPVTLVANRQEDFRLVYQTSDDLTGYSAAFHIRPSGLPAVWTKYDSEDATPLVEITSNEDSWEVVFSMPWADFLEVVGDRTSGSWLLTFKDDDDVIRAEARGFWKRDRDDA